MNRPARGHVPELAETHNVDCQVSAPDGVAKLDFQLYWNRQDVQNQVTHTEASLAATAVEEAAGAIEMIAAARAVETMRE